MTISIDISNDEYDNREKLYEYYFDILEQINGEKKKLDNEEFKEIIVSTNIQTILYYIKESIPILILKKIEEYKNNNQKVIDTPIYIINPSIENQLKRYENQIKYYIKIYFELLIERDSLKNKINYYMKIEENFKEMSEKLKYKNGHFLDNDRKENEIEILRRENSNIKKAIFKIEEENKNLKSEILKNENIINNLKEQINNLSKKINMTGKKQKDSNNNSSININNSGRSISNLIFKRNIQLRINKNLFFGDKALSSRSKLMSKNKKKKKIGLLENTFSSSFGRKTSNEKSISPKNINYYQTSSKHIKFEDDAKTKEIIDKYFNNNKRYFDYSKVSKLIKNSKYSRQLHHSIFSSQTKINQCTTEKNISYS